MRRLLIVWLALTALAAAGCGKGAAETALLAADEAVLRVRPEAEAYAPGEFAALMGRAAAARAAFDRGDYRGARELASALPAHAEEVRQAAEDARDALAARWDELSGTLPVQLSLVAAKLGALAAMRRPPTFISPEQAETARRRLAEASESWSGALRAFNGGELPDAVARAGAARAIADELAALLEPVVLPPAAPQ